MEAQSFIHDGITYTVHPTKVKHINRRREILRALLNAWKVGLPTDAVLPDHLNAAWWEYAVVRSVVTADQPVEWLTGSDYVASFEAWGEVDEALYEALDQAEKKLKG